MDEPRRNKHPEILQEVMYDDHGTRVLITDPAADVYLDRHREEQEKMEVSIEAKVIIL